MEFFSWMIVPQIVLSFLSFEVDDTVASVVAMQRMAMIISLSVAGGLYVIGHIFGGIGLYTMAKRAGDKFAWMAFVPFLNTYLSGRLAGETSVFGVKVKRIGLYVTIAEVLYVGIEIFSLVLSMQLLNAAWCDFATQNVNGVQVPVGLEYVLDRMPIAMRWMPTAETVVAIVAEIWSLITLFAFIMLYSAFFRKYYAGGPFVMAFLCSFFPVRGYVLFAVRHNTPVDYNQWMQERIRRMQQQQQPHGPYGGGGYGGGPYGGPYGGGSGEGYGGSGGNGGGPQSPDEPFSDASSDEPFSDL